MTPIGRLWGTGPRKLVALTSTWGPESLLRRRPGLPAQLATSLPYDAYQLALIVHPNERRRIGTFDLSQRLAPATDAGLLVAEEYEEWAAVLVACDAVITDHGSAALYAAALGRPLISACDGGAELIPGTPMAEFLAHGPRLPEVGPTGLEAALAAHRADAVESLAQSAFAQRGRALERLQEELYRLLDLTAPASAAHAPLLPTPREAVGVPGAFAVRVRLDGSVAQVERLAVHTAAPAHHLAAEHGAAGERQLQSAAVIYRRPARPTPAPHRVAWTADGWIGHVLDGYPGCRTAAAVLSRSECLVQGRNGPLLAVRIAPCRTDDRIVCADPAAVLSAVHVWLAARPVPAAVPSTALTCLIGNRAFRAELRPATAEEAKAALP